MKLIKWLLWLVLFLLVVAVGGAIFLVSTVDPNSLKPQISRQVESVTGRQLHLGGDLSWQFYPWVGITVNDFALSNREGFMPENMLEAGQVDVQIKLIPLLSKQLEIGKVKLQAPKISLSVNAAGETNWDDLAGAESESNDTSPETEAGAMLGGLVIQGVDISDGEIRWDDQAAGQQYHLEGFNLDTGTIEPGSPVDFHLSTRVSGSDLPAPAVLELEASVLLNEAMDNVTLTDIVTKLDMDQSHVALRLEMLNFLTASSQLSATGLTGEASDASLDVEGKLNLGGLDFNLDTSMLVVDRLDYTARYQSYPFSGETSAVKYDLVANQLEIGAQSVSAEYNGVPAGLRAHEIKVDLGQELLQVPVLEAALGDAVIETGIEVRQLLGDLQANGRLISNSFNPRQLIEALGMQDLLPEMPAQSLQSLALQGDFKAGLNAISLLDLRVMLDQSTLSGSFSLDNFEQPAYRFDLSLDQINVDDYIPQEQQAVAEEAGPAAAVVLPLAELRGLDAKGQIMIGEFKAMDLVTDNLLIKVDSAEDRIEVSPLKAQLYGGSIENSLVYDIAGEVPAVAINSELVSLDLGPFLRALQITDRFDGLGSVTADLTARGRDADAAVANLNGKIDISLNDGAITGVDIQKSLIKVESALNALAGKELGLSADLGDKTEFSEFSSQITITNGIMNVRKIDLKAPAIRVGGNGTVDLVREQLDMSLDVSVVGSFEGQGGEAVDKLKGQTIPMKISGPLSDPSILPDITKLLQGELEKELSKQLGADPASGQSLEDTLKQQLNEKLAEELGGAGAAGTAPAGAKTPVPSGSDEPNADIFGSGDSTGSGSDSASSGNEDIFGEPEKAPAKTEPAPEPEPKSLEDQLKDELKGKLLKGLFGN